MNLIPQDAYILPSFTEVATHINDKFIKDKTKKCYSVGKRIQQRI